MTDVPNGWVATRFCELFDFKGGSQPPKETFVDHPRNGYVRLLQIRDFESDDKAVYIKEHPRWPRCTADDIMVGRYGASVGKVLTGKAGAYNVALVKMLFDRSLLDASWVRLFLLSDFFQDPLRTISRSAQNGFNKDDLSEIKVTLPPLPEQRRIVAKIERLSANYRRASDHLDHVPRLVEKYKHAILAAAFRGKLIGLSAGPTELPDPKCWDLPVGWKWIRFSDAADIVSNLVRPETVPDLPHIAPDNVESGTGRLLPYRTIKEDKVISPKHRFRTGQLIYSKIRPYLRKAIIAPFEGACSADMYPLTPKAGVSSSFLLYWLISEQFASFTLDHEGRTVLPKINQVGLNSTPFPLAPVDTQDELARRIKATFTWIDQLASEATSARALTNHLDQAILAKAFRGELVPQDPNDESATALLERIRARQEIALSSGRAARGASSARRVKHA